MSAQSQRWTMGGGAMVLVFVAILLWHKFFKPGHLGWNLFLAPCLSAASLVAYFLKRFFRDHIDEIGEARFDTRNPDRPNG